MKRLLLAIGFVLVFTSLSMAANIPYVATTISDATGGVGITTTGNPLNAICVLSGAPIMWTFGNPVPTSSTGMPMYPGDYLTLNSNDKITTFRGIRTGGTSGVLHCVIQ